MKPKTHIWPDCIVEQIPESSTTDRATMESSLKQTFDSHCCRLHPELCTLMLIDLTKSKQRLMRTFNASVVCLLGCSVITTLFPSSFCPRTRHMLLSDFVTQGQDMTDTTCLPAKCALSSKLRFDVRYFVRHSQDRAGCKQLFQTKPCFELVVMILSFLKGHLA